MTKKTMVKEENKGLTKAEEKKLYKRTTGANTKQVGEVVIAQAMHSVPVMSINGIDIEPGTLVQLMMAGLEPQDQLDGMLAAQMLALHNMAMECAGRTMVSGQSFEARDMNLKHVTKLMNAFTNAVTVLDKRRGKGQQKITVEHQHVQVEAGGQAIIGDVHNGGGDD